MNEYYTNLRCNEMKMNAGKQEWGREHLPLVNTHTHTSFCRNDEHRAFGVMRALTRISVQRLVAVGPNPSYDTILLYIFFIFLLVVKKWSFGLF